MKIQAFHKPNSNSGISDVVSLLQLTIINYLMLWDASARAAFLKEKRKGTWL